jgi:hypothetical protein
VIQEAVQFLNIWLLCIVAAIVYGVIHDQVTARVCIEYFTVGHPPVFHTTSPTLLALGWGVIATWWMGAFLGFIVALCARYGSPPKINARDLIRPILVLLLVMGLSALCAGVIGYIFAQRGQISLHDLDQLIGRQKAVRFMADFCAHLTSYFVGFFGGLFVCGWILVRRIRPRITEQAGI